MTKIVLLGCGGHAKSIVDSIESMGGFQIVGFTDSTCNAQFSYRGYEIIGTDDYLSELFASGVNAAFICIGYLGKGTIREILYNQLKEIGFSLPIIVDPSAVIAKDAQIGEGTFIGKRAVVNADAKIGKMTIINTGAIVEHDCNIGDFSHVAVGTVLCGGVEIGVHSMIGANATVIQNVVLPRNSFVKSSSMRKE